MRKFLFFFALVVIFAACGNSCSQQPETKVAVKTATKSVIREKHLSSWGKFTENKAYYMIVDEVGSKKRGLVEVHRETFTNLIVGDTTLIEW